jgi:TolA-binding protein
MSPKVKLAAYAVLILLAAWFGASFYIKYSAVTAAAARAGAADMESAAPSETPAAANLEASNPPSTNVLTNVVAQITNPPAAPTNAPAKTIAKKTAPPPDMRAVRGAMMGYLVALIGSLIGLGLLITLDVTHFVGSRAMEYLFIDAGEAMRDPLYERAEAEWTNGKYLEAVQLLRDYLKKNPREMHAALRIAEIYEKDLHNSLAAALEYEEVLRHKLPDERWAWAAIHLCNLYSRLGQQQKALVLLRRVAEEYPKTGAAKKARAHLGLPEPVVAEEKEAPEKPEEDALPSIDTAPAPLEPEPPAPEPPKSNLPPGFRPKK